LPGGRGGPSISPQSHRSLAPAAPDWLASSGRLFRMNSPRPTSTLVLRAPRWAKVRLHPPPPAVLLCHARYCRDRVHASPALLFPGSCLVLGASSAAASCRTLLLRSAYVVSRDRLGVSYLLPVLTAKRPTPTTHRRLLHHPHIPSLPPRLGPSSPQGPSPAIMDCPRPRASSSPPMPPPSVALIPRLPSYQMHPVP